MKTLKVLSALLTYPTEALTGAVPEIRQVLAVEALVPPRHRVALDGLLNDLAVKDLYDLQERYILLFDRTRSLSLHLFEHVHGESRDRGQAMVDLLKLYEEGGYSPTPSELPDFLPLFLEYASTLPPQAALDLIAEPSHVFAALRERLAKRRTPYEAVFAVLVDLADGQLDAAALAALRAEPDPEPDDLDALDAAWEEVEVTFGPGAADACGKDSLIAKIRQARRPAPGLETAVSARS
ncbi:nitrate reductase molybdenum cofactor assembly chaperone [Elstera cyanobacteriorum]|uniref:Nitrate reductase molybdenum cofactor assembly chaperone n=1 Tax=Elstera cyanobacteriorum TaxID=2022747 RepID=A0A255XQM0_9PROT|nr:nitrate reductase molybdenum cofactor assembly chaperone [Elstera cyanobacteriorum]MCK6444714.1 nitrate reductase molybdenum cofactor assembly chaperone [Elstera cyanobacteriorum]OYQ19263.1 nitrate reductase molybdenum cofactor assembly chaperone [Elstera cyanobacteriorum]GFZ90173.1 hypothetical protein GCM10011497_19650 [Elstera cyanobacteriorum]